MLVIKFQMGEKVYIGDDITVQLQGVYAGRSYLYSPSTQIKIGIEAPIDISVHREKVYKKIKEEERRRDND